MALQVDLLIGMPPPNCPIPFPRPFPALISASGSPRWCPLVVVGAAQGVRNYGRNSLIRVVDGSPEVSRGAGVDMSVAPRSDSRAGQALGAFVTATGDVWSARAALRWTSKAPVGLLGEAAALATMRHHMSFPTVSRWRVYRLRFPFIGAKWTPCLSPLMQVGETTRPPTRYPLSHLSSSVGVYLDGATGEGVQLSAFSLSCAMERQGGMRHPSLLG